MALLIGRRRDALEDQVEQRPEVGPERLGIRIQGRLPGPRVAVDDRKLDLGLVCVEVEEELVHLVDDGLDPRVGPIDLVDDEDHRQPRLERLAQHEPRLRQRALARVDEQQHPVDHRQAALDLAAEIGVAGRVDDVDLRPAVADGGVLGEDRDPLLALEIHRVEHALGDVLVGAEGARLPQHRVDERRLAVIDVRDDGDVANIGADGHRPRVAAAGPFGTHSPLSAVAQARLLRFALVTAGKEPAHEPHTERVGRADGSPGRSQVVRRRRPRRRVRRPSARRPRRGRAGSDDLHPHARGHRRAVLDRQDADAAQHHAKASPGCRCRSSSRS